MKLSKEIFSKGEKICEEFIKFNKTAISPYHAVSNVESLLKTHNFIRLEEEGEWHLQKGANYYLTRGTCSSLIAFSIPQGACIEKTAFKIIGTHTDSPCLRLAPKFEAKGSALSQTYVQTYGGGLWHTWYDRDLALGGRVSVRKGKETQLKLFTSKGAIAKVPTLAIHLQKERNKLEIDKEVHMRPILASEMFEEIEGKCSLRKKIAEEFGVAPEDITDFDLCFADTAEISRFGLNSEFISSARLDNLFSVFCSLQAMLSFIGKHEKTENLADIPILAMFDHEEIGSETFVGANSSFMKSILKRITANLNLCPIDSLPRIMSRSFLLSCDMAHAQHPNFASHHQTAHNPKLNQGIILKTNCNGRYSSDGVSSSIVRRISEIVEVPLNDFIVSNESPCGTTIGPILSSKLGCLAADIGAPMLGMHSIRETAGIVDFWYYQRLMEGFLETQMKDLIPKPLA